MEKLWKADLGNGRYRNPVLFADYSDPDVIRVGETYYMTASSFNYIPGLPILTSRDLVNWTLVNYALKRIGADECCAQEEQPITYENYDIPQHAKGVWAPAIRWHEGYFYIFYGMPDEGIFMVKAKDALGEWEHPVCVMAGKGRIDPCPFWDDDGKAYVIHAYAKSRIGFKSYLGIFEIDPVTGEAVSEDRIFYDGNQTQPTIEGPKVYKRDGMYYILAPAGGVRTGWQTALRAKDIHGPYEEKVVMHQGGTAINGPHQGGLTDTVNGDEWFVHFQDRGLYGRIVHLQPVTWVDGWPAMGCNIADCCGEPVEEWTCPNVGPAVRVSRDAGGYLEACDDFSGETLNLMWQWTGNPQADFYSLKERPGRLRLYSRNSLAYAGGTGEQQVTLWECSNVLTQKLVCPEFAAECSLDVSALQPGERAGFVMFGGEYAFLQVRRDGDGWIVEYGTSEEENGRKKELTKRLAEIPEDASATFSLTLTGGPQVHMYYRIGDGAIKEVQQANSFVPSDHTWVGAKLGIFAVADSGTGRGYADFAYVHVTGALS